MPASPTAGRTSWSYRSFTRGRDELVQDVGSAQKGHWLFLFPFVHSTICLEFPGIAQLLNQDVAPQKVVFCPSQINQPRAWFSPSIADSVLHDSERNTRAGAEGRSCYEWNSVDGCWSAHFWDERALFGLLSWLHPNTLHQHSRVSSAKRVNPSSKHWRKDYYHTSFEVAPSRLSSDGHPWPVCYTRALCHTACSGLGAGRSGDTRVWEAQRGLYWFLRKKAEK